jgi:hypothetical protein
MQTTRININKKTDPAKLDITKLHNLKRNILF